MQPHINQLLVCDYDNHRMQILSAIDEVQPVYAIGEAGHKSNTKGAFNRPLGVCCSPDGSFAVADCGNHRVQRFDAGGRFLTTFGSYGDNEDQFNRPYDICALHHHFTPSSSASSLLLVTDRKNHRLSIWSSGDSQHIASNQVIGCPRGVCVDLNGYVYVSVESHIIYVFDPRKSNRLQTLGDYQAGSAPGQLSYPAGMCVDDLNMLMVVEQGNHRVQFFD